MTAGRGRGQAEITGRLLEAACRPPVVFFYISHNVFIGGTLWKNSKINFFQKKFQNFIFLRWATGFVMPIKWCDYFLKKSRFFKFRIFPIFFILIGSPLWFSWIQAACRPPIFRPGPRPWSPCFQLSTVPVWNTKLLNFCYVSLHASGLEPLKICRSGVFLKAPFFRHALTCWLFWLLNTEHIVMFQFSHSHSN